jgi:PleD family two-component response regulator
VSVGAATTHAGDGTAAALVAASDAALYDAKLRGGDRVAAVDPQARALDV